MYNKVMEFLALLTKVIVSFFHYEVYIVFSAELFTCMYCLYFSYNWKYPLGIHFENLWKIVRNLGMISVRGKLDSKISLYLKHTLDVE